MPWRRVGGYFFGILVALELLVLAVLPFEIKTLSSMAAVARNRGKKWGCVLCNIFDTLHAQHCDRTQGHLSWLAGMENEHEKKADKPR